ncbi:MAG: RDD family protein [Bacteroidota bacterium]
MEGALDESIRQKENTSVTYGGFWLRFVATLLDTLVLAPITFGVSYYNIVSLKSAPAMIFITIISIAYKPFMEFYYGATLGKMAVNLKVVNHDLERPDLQTVLLRNIFHIVPTLIVAVLEIPAYSSDGFQSVSGYMEFSNYIEQFSTIRIVNLIAGLIVIVEAIMIGTDDEKRSWHDRIARTYVIEK